MSVSPGAPVSEKGGEGPDLAHLNFLERAFDRVGRLAARHSWKFVLGSLVLTVGLAAGFAVLKTENRPEKLWVPSTAESLVQNEWVKSTWPSKSRWNSYIAACPADAACNMLEPARIQELAAVQARIMAIEVDGDAMVKEYDALYLKKDATRPWKKYAGMWSFQSKNSTTKKCFSQGPFCMMRSITDIFHNNASDIAALTQQDIVTAMNAPTAAGAQPLDMAQMASSGKVDGVPAGPKKDAGGKYTGHASALFGSFTLNRDDTYVIATGRSEDPVANEWERRALCELGILADAKGLVKAGVVPELTCPGPKLISFKPQFSRSLSDEFGVAIRGDISKLGPAYGLMIFYLILMLSRYDPAHSMVCMSLIAVLIVGMSYAAGMGLGGLLGLYNNNLNSNIPFLLLGLGVDDAFVLVGEYRRATTQNPKASIEDRIAEAMRNGGMSVLITSATDALAFLVGSMTVLPALSWFCLFSGFGVIFCFIFQITFFMPILAIDARRAERNKADCCCCVNADTMCCIKAAAAPSIEHFEKPRGCCCRGCFLGSHKPNGLGRGMRTFGEKITTNAGKAATLLLFGGLLIVGVLGAANIVKDFKLEWFIPDDSYVNQFSAANDEYFATGVPFQVHVKGGADLDFFALENQKKMRALKTWLAGSALVDQTEAKADWQTAFLGWAKASSTYTQQVTGADGYFTGPRATYYAALHAWYLSASGARYRGSVLWEDPACAFPNPGNKLCDAAKGLKAVRVASTYSLKVVTSGVDRYNTMVATRTGVAAILPAAFPFSFQFLYWEEVGVIDEELIRNLLICFVVIMVMVSAMIQNMRVAPAVIFTIAISIVDVVGLLHWWDVTISGVSTIYILICVGLAVDYSAHIAHMFKESVGTANQRAVEALARIGPSVFNAVVSTFLAVLVMSTMKSYVFRIFFKALFLVTIVAGLHGLWLLPVLLSIVGGDKEAAAPAATEGKELDEKP